MNHLRSGVFAVGEFRYHVSKEIQQKAVEFATQRYRNYSDTNQNNPDKTFQDDFVGKVGEDVARQWLVEFLSSDITEIDFEIYSLSERNWNPDFYLGDIGIHVKSCLVNSPWGISWIFQKDSSRRKDDLFKQKTEKMNDIIVCVQISHSSINENLYGDVLVVNTWENLHRKMRKPILNHLKASKAALYYNTLLEQENTDWEVV